VEQVEIHLASKSHFCGVQSLEKSRNLRPIAASYAPPDTPHPLLSPLAPRRPLPSSLAAVPMTSLTVLWTAFLQTPPTPKSIRRFFTKLIAVPAAAPDPVATPINPKATPCLLLRKRQCYWHKASKLPKSTLNDGLKYSSHFTNTLSNPTINVVTFVTAIDTEGERWYRTEYFLPSIEGVTICVYTHNNPIAVSLAPPPTSTGPTVTAPIHIETYTETVTVYLTRSSLAASWGVTLAKEVPGGCTYVVIDKVSTARSVTPDSNGRNVKAGDRVIKMNGDHYGSQAQLHSTMQRSMSIDLEVERDVWVKVDEEGVVSRVKAKNVPVVDEAGVVRGELIRLELDLTSANLVLDNAVAMQSEAERTADAYNAGIR